MPERNQIQESVLKAIDSLVNDRLNRYATDKTITGVIVKCNNSLTGEYTVNYQGGNLIAFADEGVAYSKSTSVYVLVPEGNFSNKKIILGKASTIEDDQNITFVSSMVSDYNPVGRNTLTTKEGFSNFGLHSYLREDYYLIYDYDNQENSAVDFNVEEFQNYLKESEAIMIEASFRTRLPVAHRNTKTGIYGLQFVLAFKDRSTDEEVYKTWSYVLDTNSMTGNPYAYNNWADQYAIFPIDIPNFSHIQSIMFYSQGFVEQDDLANDALTGADIWCKELEIHGLRKITAINGDYSLRISTPHGATFRTSTPNESLDVIAETRYQNVISDGWMFYWFRQDARVTTASNNYKMYGGTGWASLEADKGTTKTITLYERENRAFENKYLCVAVYKEEIILKEYFTLYNDTARRELEIVSNLGNKFSFDRGTPTLTCQIDGKQSDFDADSATHRPDSWFTFVWSKIDAYGQVSTFDKTKEELQKEYDDALVGNAGYMELSALKNQIMLMEGVEFNRNVLTYPVRSIENTTTFRCSVYLKDREDEESYSIGSADIVLQNENAAIPSDYYILIENGDQVFQYSESGVTPASDRYRDPQDILPLQCHFYDPAGLEVNNNTYEVKWLVPLEGTLLVPPASLHLNPSTGKIEWFLEKIYPTEIAENFDYQALNNQITCIVNYNGQEYTKDTRFSFVKIGDNGTNGTDIAVKISPTSESNILDKDLLTLWMHNNDTFWNTGQAINEKVLDFDIYQREQKLLPNTVTWTIAGSTSSILVTNMYEGEDGRDGVRLAVTGNARAQRNQIVKGQTTLEVTLQGNDDGVSDIQRNRTTYYGFYGIPIIKSYAGVTYPLHIDNKYTLKQIVYNADGRNPLYNKNQGVKIRYDGADAANKMITFQALGGEYENVAGDGNTCAFKLMQNRDDYKDSDLVSGQLTLRFDENGECLVYILPEDVYSGLYTNNLVHGSIYSSGQLEAEFWVPIHMQLNTVGLASLNAWDGNHIEINEEDNYILAPQVGAGEKDKDNRFSGVVIGKAQTYDQKSASLGLLGYSHGKQSIFLDAMTGNAIFGLTEDDALDPNNPLTEGRIELIPGGVSSIARWKIDSRSFYNVVDGNIGSEYSDAPTGAQRSIPHDKQGVLLNADPAYLSIKGRLLTARDVDPNAANTIVEPGDALELQLDPNDMSIFTIYRHFKQGDRWYRKPLVGINGIGQFYANTLEMPLGNSSSSTQTTALTIGYIGAFGVKAAAGLFAGANIDINGVSLFKMFTDVGDTRGGTLYLSGSNNVNNEYVRPMSLHGDTISLYAGVSSADRTSPNSVIVQRNEVDLDVNGGIQLHLLGIGESTLITKAFKRNINGNYTNTITGTEDTTVKGNVTKLYGHSYTRTVGMEGTGNTAITTHGTHTETVDKDVTFTFGGKETRTITGNLLVNTASAADGFTIEASNGSFGHMKLGSRDSGNQAFLDLKRGNARTELRSHYGLNIYAAATGGMNSTGNGIEMVAGNNGQIRLSSTTGSSPSNVNEVMLSLLSQNGNTGDWKLSSPQHGSIISDGNINIGGIGIRAGVHATPGFASPWILADGAINGTNNVGLLVGQNAHVNGHIFSQTLVDTGVRSDASVTQWIIDHNKWAGDLEKKVIDALDRVGKLEGRMTTAENNISAAQQTANNALNVANSKADANHSHSGYASSSHAHNVYYSIMRANSGVGINNASINSVGSSGHHSARTSGPA